MKQIMQHLNTGILEVAEAPSPAVTRGHVLIQTRRSLISAGTERMLVEFSKGNLLQKARSQPDKVRQVIDKIKTDGLMPTLENVFKRLDEPMPLGYCNAGTVVAVGAGVDDLKSGDRVASNGSHAEYVCVPRHLCAAVPEGVTDEAAAFTVLGSIALQGIRLAAPTFGETIAVYGAGLVGLMTIQLLKSCGCRVLAIDLNEARLTHARAYGADTVNSQTGGNPVTAAGAMTNGEGVDGVIITASAKNDAIVHEAALMTRKRGRIILVGVVGLNLSRADFYEKELTFQVSCSYGPGRYDEKYELNGQDYPLGFVRWTEQRNFEAILNAMAAGQLNVLDLVTDRVAFEDAASAYDTITSDPNSLGVVLQYSGDDESLRPTIRIHDAAPASPNNACVAVMIGAGNFAKMTMAPALQRTGARLKYVADIGKPVAATHLARKYGFEHATSDTDAALADPEVNAVFIATGHSSHAALVCRALEAGKHVFVEKPLALNSEQIDSIMATATRSPGQQVMLGFNRRFSAHTLQIKRLLAGRSEPLTMSFTCNAGIIPPDVWVHDPERGGGRIIGEACHFMDLLSYLADSPIAKVAAFQVDGGVAIKEDKMAIILHLADGSVGTINYFANGHKAFPKEQLEIFSDGRVLRLDNFRKLQGWGFPGFTKLKTRIDKGHRNEFSAFVNAVKQGGVPLIELRDAVNVTLASFAAVVAAREKRVINVES